MTKDHDITTGSNVLLDLSFLQAQKRLVRPGFSRDWERVLLVCWRVPLGDWLTLQAAHWKESKGWS